jgi:hypothetical protein
MSLARVAFGDNTDAPLLQARGISDELTIVAATPYDLTIDPTASGNPVHGAPILVTVQAITTPGALKYYAMKPDGFTLDATTVRTWTIANVGDTRPRVGKIIASGSTFAGTLGVLW